MEIISNCNERITLKKRVKKLHEELLADLSDFLIEGTPNFTKWKFFVSSRINNCTTMEKIKDRSVLEDFNDLESVGALSPGKYEVLKDIFSMNNLEKRAVERIKETEALMKERDGGLSTFLKRWNPGYYPFQTYLDHIHRVRIHQFLNFHFDDIFEEGKPGSIGRIKVASIDAYNFDPFDTGYNFLISESGAIYEDRGWDSEGKSGNGLDICFLGSRALKTKEVSQEARRALEDLLTYGLYNRYFTHDYTMQVMMPANSKRNHMFSEENNRKRPRR